MNIQSYCSLDKDKISKLPERKLEISLSIKEPYTPEQFATEAIEPIPLNVKISDVLFRNGTIEQISTGFERTFHLCREYDIAYSYTETANGSIARMNVT